MWNTEYKAKGITVLRYSDWLHREAALRGIKPNEMEREIKTLDSFILSGRVFFGDPDESAWTQLEQKVHQEGYDIITDFSMDTVYRIFVRRYYVSGVGVIFKKSD